MKVTLAVVVTALLGALALAGRVDRDTPPRVRPAASPAGQAPAAADQPLLQRAGNRRVRPVSPRSLQPVAKPIRLPLSSTDGALSPDGRRAAFAGSDPQSSAVAVVDVRRGRAGRRIPVGGFPLQHLTWLTNDRFLVFSGIGRGGTDLVEVDAARGRVLSRRHFRAEPIATARSSDGVVALLAPPGEIGFARLLVRRPGRADRTIRSRWVRAGIDRTDPGDAEMRASNVQPGLAVDPERDVAYVVDAETDRLTEVRLDSETTREGPLARASKVVESRVRYAAWLGDGKLAVAGHRDHPDGRIEPHGLRIVDVEHPRRPQRMLAPRQDFLAAGDGHVVAWQIGGGGIAVFDREGRRVHRRLRGVLVPHVDVHGRYAYVHTQDRSGRDAGTRVIELSSGRQVGRGRAAVAARASAAPTPQDSVLGVAYTLGPQGRIARYDPVTLERQGRGAAVHGRMWDWDVEPGGGRVALGVSNRGRIEIFDAETARRRGRIETGRQEGLTAIRWVSRDRILALGGQSRTEALEIDVRRRRVLSRRGLGHRYAVARTADGLAVLVGPREREGEAELILIRPGEPLRSLPLPGVRAAVSSRPNIRPGDPPDLLPGLAVDGAFAYVAPPGATSIVRVDLAGGAVTSHAMRARAAKGGASQSRRLQVLAGGRLLITDRNLDHDGRSRGSSSEIVNTATWGHTLLSGFLADAIGSPEGIVLPRYRAGFLTLHDARGRRIARHDPRYGISNVGIHGRYAYVANGAHRPRNQRTHVIDLRSGRRVSVLRLDRIPHLLTRP